MKNGFQAPKKIEKAAGPEDGKDKEMKVNKGDFGYIKAQKKKRALLTTVLYAIPLTIFFTGLFITKTRLNLFTFVAIMGCLPASKCAVGMIMMLMQKPLSQEIYEKIEARRGELVMAFELTVTAYEKNTPIDSLAVCGNAVVGYSASPKADLSFAENHIRDILKGNGYRVNVKIFKDLKPYLDRLTSLNQNRDQLREGISFTPDENYPDLSREELIKHTILAISL